MIWEYSEKKSKQIPIALKEVLGLQVNSIKRLKGGEVNHSFRVDTNNGPVIVRVFGYKHWPKEESLRLIEKKLEELKIRQSKIIYFNRSKKYFKHGFMVGEWIDGVPGNKAINRGLVKRAEITKQTAKILKKVHTIKFKKFGKPPFKKGKGTKDFSHFVLNFDSKNNLGKLVKEKLIPNNLVDSGINLLKDLLNKIDFTVEPVMVHSDPAPDNVIWTKKGPVLIDWDGAKATSWIYDAAWITYWLGEKMRKPFLQGYGAKNIKMTDFRLLENIFHLALCLELLPYYAYSVQDKTRLKPTIKKLKKIIKSSTLFLEGKN